MKRFMIQKNYNFSIPGFFKNATEAMGQIKNHVSFHYNEPGINNQNMHNIHNTGLLFSDMANEWKAVVTQNPYDINIFNYINSVQSQNFGTIDNPLIVYTSENSFRYVGCSGQSNEDDFEGHELFIFMLREGPLQRCSTCGQVFKLVKLRDEFSEEMDYYVSNMHPMNPKEMGDSSSMGSGWKGLYYQNTMTQRETDQSIQFTLVPSDLHDRIVTDPAFRLEYLQKQTNKREVYDNEVKNITKQEFENMQEIKTAIEILEEKERKITRFAAREILSGDNHERREKRMNQRHEERQNKGMIYIKADEDQLKYDDYFESEEANEVQNTVIPANNFNFFEGVTRIYENDLDGLINKMAYKFKYRQNFDSKEQYAKRQKRMEERQKERLSNYNQILKEVEQNPIDIKNQEKYIDFVVEDSKKMYKDYFESENVDEIFDCFTPENNVKFASNFEVYHLNNAKIDESLYIQQNYDDEKGFFSNQIMSNFDLYKRFYQNENLFKFNQILFKDRYADEFKKIESKKNKK